MNIGKVFLVLNPRKEIVFKGPPIDMQDRFLEFKREHKKIVITAGKSYAKEKNNLSFDKFLHEFLNKEEKTIREMGVSEINLVKLS